VPYTRRPKNPLGHIWHIRVLPCQGISLDHIGIISMGEIFLTGVVIIVLCVLAEEFLEAYDEWRKGIDDEENY